MRDDNDEEEQEGEKKNDAGHVNFIFYVFMCALLCISFFLYFNAKAAAIAAKLLLFQDTHFALSPHAEQLTASHAIAWVCWLCCHFFFTLMFSNNFLVKIFYISFALVYRASRELVFVQSSRNAAMRLSNGIFLIHKCLSSLTVHLFCHLLFVLCS